MSVTMTEVPGTAPAVERRGTGAGEFDWGRVRPGEEFPDQADQEDPAGCDDLDDRDTAPFWAWCGVQGCGGD